MFTDVLERWNKHAESGPRMHGVVSCKNEEWFGIIIADGIEHFFAMFDCGVETYLHQIEEGVGVTFQLKENIHGTQLVQDVKIDDSCHAQRLVGDTESKIEEII